MHSFFSGYFHNEHEKIFEKKIQFHEHCLTIKAIGGQIHTYRYEENPIFICVHRLDHHHPKTIFGHYRP